MKGDPPDAHGEGSPRRLAGPAWLLHGFSRNSFLATVSSETLILMFSYLIFDDSLERNVYFENTKLNFDESLERNAWFQFAATAFEG